MGVEEKGRSMLIEDMLIIAGLEEEEVRRRGKRNEVK